MLDAMRSIPETLKNWSESRDLVYGVVASIAAFLVVIAVTTGSRPTDSLAVVAHGFGLSSLSEWLTETAPPFVAARAPGVHEVLLVATSLLFTFMIFVPLLRNLHADSNVFTESCLRLIGSPAAATVWVLLAVAAQHGDITPMLARWAQASFAILLSLIGGLFAAGILYLLAHRRESEVVRVLRWPAVVMWRACYGGLLAFLAVMFAAIALPLSFLGWFADLESDHSRKARAARAKERAAHGSRPTGASAT
ncbi:hypothetical protein GCM10009718_10970 [Isoptericola halotolerans]|uniref:Uncharacterized protein n=1 Tax=Isoptericola halotolerans TaxID=300560 RepID=A0ABX2A089_9MICO|nr:hypothetical protein [Isoptericola halotolerans]NOV95981.1 hypothetical protein [Isoptericola halotolerans]